MEHNSSARKVLLIEDEAAIADLLSYSLRKEGLLVDTAYDGRKGLEKAEQGGIDLILLDLMLPDMSGFDICREMSGCCTAPIIILTAKADIVDKVVGFELGAFDYITKPFDVREVIARVKAVMRRSEQSAKQDNHAGRITYRKLAINLKERTVCKGDIAIELTPKEFDLFAFLLENKGTVFTREKLLDSVWGFDYVGDSRTVDIHIVRLRKKLDDPGTTSMIETVFGVGYKLVK